MLAKLRKYLGFVEGVLNLTTWILVCFYPIVIFFVLEKIGLISPEQTYIFSEYYSALFFLSLLFSFLVMVHWIRLIRKLWSVSKKFFTRIGFKR